MQLPNEQPKDIFKKMIKDKAAEESLFENPMPSTSRHSDMSPLYSRDFIQSPQCGYKPPQQD
ncbi:hypothetical protein M514_23561 [Trichuris suis]|uniref:Uncharacterized protein n=1 Tax=Trichuris suis TaxID=68888 RepID=A0A085N481_9BILA|nr:hypothetical protein M514_23561 [Trichuris suis]